MSSVSQRQAKLLANTQVLLSLHKGIEKEGLRVTPNGHMSLADHPAALGSALTNARITTDYSEALLELVTGIHSGTNNLLGELYNIHAFVTQNIGDELIWNQSMPCILPPDDKIPVGKYGSSNSGMLKHVYRLGLAERYGKAMQCIAGIHYNLSVPDTLWGLLETEGKNEQEQRSNGYLALIRNFMRHTWLLMYLFGASPAVDLSFFQGRKHPLQELGNNTLFLPYATSLRMSDIGYQNKAQSDLQLCYNDLDTFVARIYNAVTTPWPAYEAIGTHRNGKRIQLNTNILQIENEYYSSIRPKRVTRRGERPGTALSQRGVEYVEVRCMDIDPFDPIGISHETSLFLDTFLLFCAVEESPCFPDGGFCRESHENFGTVVREGRKPGLELMRDEQPIKLNQWATEIIDRMLPYAEMLDSANNSSKHVESLNAQAAKVKDPESTPSARVLNSLKTQNISLQEYTLEQSAQHRRRLIAHKLNENDMEQFRVEVAQSFADQLELEENDSESFEQYVARFHEALVSS